MSPSAAAWLFSVFLLAFEKHLLAISDYVPGFPGGVYLKEHKFISL